MQDKKDLKEALASGIKQKKKLFLTVSGTGRQPELVSFNS